MNQREHRHQNENGNDEGADRVGDAHVVALGVSDVCVSYLDEEGGENDAHGAQRVRQHVQEHAAHVLVLLLTLSLHTHMPVTVIVIVIVVVTVIVVVVVVVIMTVPVIVADVVEEDEAHQVDHQTAHRRAHQLVVAHLGRLAEALHRLGGDAEPHEDEKHAVDKTREHLNATVTHGVAVVGGPLGHVGGDQPDDQRAAVEQHVTRVADQSETVVEDA